MKLSTRIAAAWRCLRGDFRGARQVLPYRRDSETTKFVFDDHAWFATISRLEDGSIAEVFLNTAKAGTSLRAMANDMAIATSLALQHGCPAETLRDAFSRNERGDPLTPIAAILDEVAK